MAKHTSIILDDHFEAFVREEVESGRYATVSEVVRDALRRLEERKRHRVAVLKALEEGEASGLPIPLDAAFEMIRKARG
jgi:antitoxin ParD1/3/4